MLLHCQYLYRYSPYWHPEIIDIILIRSTGWKEKLGRSRKLIFFILRFYPSFKSL
jgi:hypothetical protein